MDQYEKLEKIGEGSYGKGVQGQGQDHRPYFALKKCRINLHEQGIPASSLHEILLLKLLCNDSYVARLISVEHVVKNEKRHIFLVFEYFDTDLKKFIDSYRHSLNPVTLPPKMIQDLKPHNLFVDNNKGLLKIGDLGLGRAFTVLIKSCIHEIATLWYRARELLLGSAHYSTAVDIWSVGCIFAEMVTTKPLFPGYSEINTLFCIFRLLGTPTEEMWPWVKILNDWHIYPEWKPKNLASVVPSLLLSGVDLLSKMLEYNPGRRISAKEAVDHPYFDDLDKSQL